jgi:hypothetical protein
MPTKTDELSGQQLKAVDMLATGVTITGAAEAVGVSRQTVSEWANKDSNFRAALNKRRAELWTEQTDRVRALLPQAVDRIERALALDDGDSLRAALALLKLAGVSKLYETGTTDPTFDFLCSVVTSQAPK